MRLHIILSIVILGVFFYGASGSTGTAPLAAAESCALSQQAEFTGAASCKKCHFKHYLSWKKTTMAKSMKSLTAGKMVEVKKKFGLDPNKDYTRDVACLECHTTGYGKPGGFPKVVPGKEWTDEEKKRAKKLGGVQCESCHGPGSLANPFKKENEAYKKSELSKLGIWEPDAANCKTCHTKESPTVKPGFKFDYEDLIKDPKKIHKHIPMKHKH